MAVEVIMPRVDMDMATGKISKWHVKAGDAVKRGAPLFEIETDKAAMEIEAPADGVVDAISVAEGGEVPVGNAVAYIFAEGEARTIAARAVPAAEASAPSTARSQAAAVAEAPSSSDSSGGLRATPLARRLAREASLSLEQVAGSGPRGRIVAEDVKQALASRSTPQAAPAKSAAPVTAPAESIRKFYDENSYEALPVDAMRRTIAERLVLSKQTIPHFYLSLTCSIDALATARETLNLRAPKGSDGKPLWRLSLNDLFIKAWAIALQRVPAANASWAGNEILKHRQSDIGVAVAVEGGLFTPIIRAAEGKPLSVISQEMKQLAAKARDRKLAPSDYQGGSSAISNLGMYGIEQFTAIINPPHATILAVGAAVERFVPVDGKPVLAQQVTFTLSCDHRVVDGAVGAKLLATFKALVEDPVLMLA